MKDSRLPPHCSCYILDQTTINIWLAFLEWGLEKADREEVEAWIEASLAGKGLHEKMGGRRWGLWIWKLGCGVGRAISE
jgi:hypothetical protein